MARRSPYHKTLLERTIEMREKTEKRLEKSRQELWNVIKNKRPGESDDKWINRIKKYGYTPYGVYVKTGISYQNKEESEMVKMNINLKSKLKELEGKVFYTVTGKPYTYKFVNESIIKTNRTNYNIHLNNFEKAMEIMPTELSEIKEVRGASYVFGIITDPRFK